MRRALLAVALLALIVPAAASAHATMKEATPAEQGRVETPPKEVTLEPMAFARVKSRSAMGRLSTVISEPGLRAPPPPPTMIAG